ncbi:hypothetical protein LIT25_21320 [Bacillus sp. F19]|nr:hypothetical protein LIT25_21320 [Bacillus sp. F19]
MSYLPEGSQTNEDIFAEIQKLDELIEENEEKRLALRLSKGQKPEAPRDFVSPELSAILVERVKPIFGFAADLADVLLYSDLPVEMGDFDKYENDLKLLRMSINPEHCGQWVNATDLLHVMELYSNGSIEAKSAVRGIANVFRIDDIMTDIYDTKSVQEILEEKADHSGPSISDYDEALAYYNEIESELDEVNHNVII